MARVTVYDVAEKAGVSTATVSFAFRHPDQVKDDTKAKVLRVAEELGYVPSGNARSLAKGRTGTADGSTPMPSTTSPGTCGT